MGLIQYMEYIYWAAMFLLIIYSNAVIDRDPRRSRIIRGAVYLSPWIPILLGLFAIDSLQIIFIILCSIACIAISLYTEGYFRILFGKISSIQVIVDSTLLILLIFFIVDTLIELIVLWISIEVLGFLLILIEKGIRNWSIASKYLVLCATTGDISLFTWIALVSIHLGVEKGIFMSFQEISMYNITANELITFLLIIGFTTKLAQIPLHFWLVDTYTESPSPITALFSGLMSKMAIYGLLRLYYTININSTIFTLILLIQGVITAVYGFLMASAQVDIKKMLAYSSMGHYGVMTMTIGLIPLNPSVFTKLTILYALYHGLLKSQVFLNTASIELLANTRNVYQLGYLAQVARDIYNPVLISFLSLIGAPPTLGFYAKFALIVLAFSLIGTGSLISFPIIVGVGFTSVFTIVYAVKYISVYTSSYRSNPVRPVIPLEEAQVFSESLLAIASILLPILMLLIGIDRIIDSIVLLVYLMGLVILATTFMYNKVLSQRETEIWFSGVEA